MVGSSPKVVLLAEKVFEKCVSIITLPCKVKIPYRIDPLLGGAFKSFKYLLDPNGKVEYFSGVQSMLKAFESSS